MVATAEDELLAELGSVALEETETELVSLPSTRGCKVTLMVAVWLLEMVPRLQVMVPPEKVQAPWDGTAETKPEFAGKGSLTTTLGAAVGPRLVTVTV